MDGLLIPGKPGKVIEFHIGQGKVNEIVVCLRFATAVAIVTNKHNLSTVK